MGEVGLGTDFNGLNSGEQAAAAKAIDDHFALLGVLQTTPWLLNLLGTIPGAAAGFSNFFGICEREIAKKERVST
jgi:hypothetical protein